MSSPPTFQGLCRLTPALAELEAETRAVHDDGTTPFFCANAAWFRIRRRLDRLLGVWRDEGSPGGEAELLSTGTAHGIAAAHLYRLLPPCRECGCTLFDPLREAQVRDRDEAQRRSRR